MPRMVHEPAGASARPADRDPQSPTATNGFDDWAPEAADRNDAQDPHNHDDIK